MYNDKCSEHVSINTSNKTDFLEIVHKYVLICFENYKMFERYYANH